MTPLAVFAEVGEVLGGAGGVLTDREESRAARLRDPRDREAYRAAHLLVRRVAARAGGLPVDEVVLEQQCPGCGSDEHGRPAIAGVAGLHVSLTHTRGWVGAVAAAGPCGIDVERVRPMAPALLARVLTDADRSWIADQADRDRAFADLWVRKEALVKVGAIDLEAVVPLREDGRIRTWSGPGMAGAWLVAD